MSLPPSPELEMIDLVDISNRHTPELGPQVQPRQPFHRQSSTALAERYEGAEGTDHFPARQPSPNSEKFTFGLGISEHETGSAQSVKRKPIGSKHTISPVTPTKTYLSPAYGSGNISQSPIPQTSPYGYHIDSWITPKGGEHSSHSFPDMGKYSDDRGLLNLSGPTIGKQYLPSFECPTNRDILSSPWLWMAISVVLLSIYSTIFSGIFLGIALAHPRWGEKIGTNGHVSYSTATLLSALFSKTIELSFVTVVVAFLGQVLSKKAFRKRGLGGGISIAEMKMRTWIMQPGTLITQWQVARYAAASVLGVAALTAAFAATFYTTAAEALVSPKLKFGRFENRVLGGPVAAAFADQQYLADICPTPITSDYSGNGGTTCLEVEHAGQGYHNFQTYLTAWAMQLDIGNTTGKTYQTRLPPTANMFDNTTVQGQWITPVNETLSGDSTIYKRFVQNITLAMPHAGVFHAARDPMNQIIQPQDLEGNGEYIIFASVPSPALNILCVGLDEGDLDPLVYSTWKYSEPINVTTWPTAPPANIPQAGEWPNATVIDKFFDFGPEAGELRQVAPIFAKYPLGYNTISNGTAGGWGSFSVYILATPPPTLTTVSHLLCSVKALQYSNCSTKYHAAMSGGQLSVHCDDDPENAIPYLRSQPAAPLAIQEPNWKYVGASWMNAIGFNGGLSDGMNSLARVLTEMIPAYDNLTYATALDPGLPSIGEAIGVLGGCTLLLSSEHAPFIHYWNVSDVNAILDPQPQYFNALLNYQDYSSGGSQHWQGLFYIILAAVFGMNVVCFCYLLWHFRARGHITDYTEPDNLFALALNSPPANALSGACGAGPEGDVLARKWQVDMLRQEPGSGGHPHFYVNYPDDGSAPIRQQVPKRRKYRSVMDFEDYRAVESPAVGQYQKLAW